MHALVCTYLLERLCVCVCDQQQTSLSAFGAHHYHGAFVIVVASQTGMATDPATTRATTITTKATTATPITTATTLINREATEALQPLTKFCQATHVETKTEREREVERDTGREMEIRRETAQQH